MKQPKPISPTAAEGASPSIGFYSESRLLDFVPVSRTTLWRLVRSGRFPAPVRLSAGRKAFSRKEVHDWMRDRIAAPEPKAAG